MQKAGCGKAALNDTGTGINTLFQLPGSCKRDYVCSFLPIYYYTLTYIQHSDIRHRVSLTHTDIHKHMHSNTQTHKRTHKYKHTDTRMLTDTDTNTYIHRHIRKKSHARMLTDTCTDRNTHTGMLTDTDSLTHKRTHCALCLSPSIRRVPSTSGDRYG